MSNRVGLWCIVLGACGGASGGVGTAPARPVDPADPGLLDTGDLAELEPESLDCLEHRPVVSFGEVIGDEVLLVSVTHGCIDEGVPAFAFEARMEDSIFRIEEPSAFVIGPGETITVGVVAQPSLGSFDALGFLTPTIQALKGSIFRVTGTMTCPNASGLDSDDDDVDDTCDVCPDGDDRLDSDADGTPDDCDTTP
ncbi:MAG: hypothetical protein AAF211_16620 [Myxococcota bacterium]